MILEAGVFIALDNPAKRRIVVALVEKMLADGTTPVTTEPVLAQAWRNPATQVPTARLVATATVFAFGDPQTVGLRCARSGTSDVVDASLAELADQLGLTILTTDPADLARPHARHVAL